MSRRMTEKKIAELVASGHGRGIGKDYLPWIHVRDDAPVYPCDDVPDGWRITGPSRAPGPGALSLGKGACTGPLFLVPPTNAAPAAR